MKGDLSFLKTCFSPRRHGVFTSFWVVDKSRAKVGQKADKARAERFITLFDLDIMSTFCVIVMCTPTMPNTCSTYFSFKIVFLGAK
jgi:hypothetical protein